MRKKIVVHVVGARPNFMKMDPVRRGLQEHANRVIQYVVHTGQHYDMKMSKIFFDQLGCPDPDFSLEIKGTRNRTERATVMINGLSNAFEILKPDLVAVYGDVDSTLAAAFAATTANIRLAHVEAGLRSFDRTMPEETNRIVTDNLADILFCPCKHSLLNLANEHISGQMQIAGNAMIDSLMRVLPYATNTIENYGIKKGADYAVATIHRPSNVDDPEDLIRVVSSLAILAKKIPIVFPVHPRTAGQIQCVMGIDAEWNDLKMIGPLGYFEFIGLVSGAKLVITDSGGIQEETTFMKVPCLTMRENTERPITTEIGTNFLVGKNHDRLINAAELIIDGHWREGQIPELWDGQTGDRIAKSIVDYLING